MKKIILTKYGPPEVLQVQDCADSRPKNNQIKVKLFYSGINFAEIMARMHLYPGAPKPPSVLGAEGSGIIEEIGEKVVLPPHTSRYVYDLSFECSQEIKRKLKREFQEQDEKPLTLKESI